VPAVDARRRFSEIDVLKAVGILTVVLIHSLRNPWDPRISSAELWLQVVTRFAVPGFLLCSGFLYATTSPVSARVTLQRVRRVVLPYLVASFGAQLWWAATGPAHDLRTAASEIALASSFGPYYYVFVHFWLVLVTPLFAVAPRRVLAGLTAGLVASQAFFEARMELVIPFFWHIRNPLLWWAYFLVGWLLRLHYAAVRSFVVEHRAKLAVALALAWLAATWVGGGQPQTSFVRSAIWLDIYVTLGLIFVAACGRERVPGWMRSLSDATFAIYLLHLFFVYGAERIIRANSEAFSPPVIGLYWAAGVAGSLAVIWAARRLLGPRSRDVVGA
jgi:surface polysaccharide O-acyltransferase-like enzyme